VCDTVMAALRQRREVSAHIQRFTDLAKKTHSFTKGPRPSRFEEYELQLNDILPVNFLETRTLEEIARCSRDMKALMIRVERAHADPAKDTLKAGRLQPYLDHLQKLRSREKDLTPDCRQQLHQFQEMVADFRIALFAPEIQGNIQVSSKKLDRMWQDIIRSC